MLRFSMGMVFEHFELGIGTHGKQDGLNTFIAF
jgi:hypothetical protein